RRDDPVLLEARRRTTVLPAFVSSSACPSPWIDCKAKTLPGRHVLDFRHGLLDHFLGYWKVGVVGRVFRPAARASARANARQKPGMRSRSSAPPINSENGLVASLPREFDHSLP